MQDIDKLLLLAKTINELVDIGENVMEDGKVNLSDIGQLGPLAKSLKDLIEVVGSAKEILEEGKDIDAGEAVQVIQELLKK